MEFTNAFTAMDVAESALEAFVCCWSPMAPTLAAGDWEILADAGTPWPTSLRRPTTGDPEGRRDRGARPDQLASLRGRGDRPPAEADRGDLEKARHASMRRSPRVAKPGKTIRSKILVVPGKIVNVACGGKRGLMRVVCHVKVIC